jgi:2-polyprenyl-3-methyl-5-hydroxy-6-metoxy-1,4-benzoquinol methylase
MSTTDFYDGLAPYFHLLYADWDSGIERQGAALTNILVEAGVPAGASVLDAACGVGTQALGLAARGYRVHASDISPGAVDRCATEAATRGLSIETTVADLRTLTTTHRQPFDAVIACDNSLPHLLTDAEIGAALRECYACTAPGGVAVYRKAGCRCPRCGGTLAVQRQGEAARSMYWCPSCQGATVASA